MQEARAQREIHALITRFKTSLEQRDLQGVKAVYGTTFEKEDEKAWTSFFKRAREIKTNIKEDIELIGDNAKVDLTIRFDYFNTSNAKDDQSVFAESWLLEQNIGSWMIAQRKSR